MNPTIEYLIKRFNVQLAQKGASDIHGVNRTEMAKVLHELDFKVGAEIGVAQGWHAEILCRENPQAKLYAVDVWDLYDGYNEYRDRIHDYYNQSVERLAPYNCEIVKAFSMDAVKNFKDGSLDFVYLDGAHDFKNVAMDVCEWSKKVRIGGIVFGHDYKRWKRHSPRAKYVVDVKDVIQAYTYSHDIFPWFQLTNDVRDPKFGRDNPGWLFVRTEGDVV